ncbi:MAG: MFS transporter [Rhizobiales bacterium]|nr:MFS transporter [Hyphomicrobiales bacterium]
MPFTFLLGLAGFSSAFSMRAVEPTLPLIAGDLNVSLQQAALLASAFALPYAATQLVFGTVADAMGKVRVMRVTLTMLSLSLIGCALAPTHTTLFIARVLSGCWAGGIIPVSFALVGDRFAFDERPAALGRILTFIVLGQLSGAATAGVLATHFGWRSVFWLSVVLTAAAGFGMMLFVQETAQRGRASFSESIRRYKVVLENPVSIRLFVIVAIEGALIFGCFPFVAAHFIEKGFAGALEAGIALGCFGLGGIAYTLSVGRLNRRFGLAAMGGAGALLAGLSFVGIAEMSWFPVLLVLFAGAGFGFYMLHNMIQILATELVPTARGSSVALYATSFWTGQAAGAVITAQVVPWVGAQGMFIGAGLGLVALSWPAVLLARRARERRAAGY